MVSKNELRVGVKFETDNQQLEVSKQKLNELIANLQLIQNQYKQTNLLGNAKEEFKQASQEAKKLEQILNSSWNSKLGQLDIGKFNNELKQSGRTIESVKANLSGAGATGTAAFNNIASSILNTNLELKKSSVLLDKMALTMANTVRFGISSSIFNSMTGAISKAYQYAVDLDTSLNNIRIVSGQSAEQMEQFAKYANQASKNLGASTLDYTDASLIYYQQGLDPEEVIERTDITMKAANALGISAQEVSEYMTAIWNNFDDGSKSLEYYADVLTALGASTASSSEEIAEGLSKFAAVGDTVGLSYEYATSALATVVAETRQSADTVGTAFKTLFARIQDLKLGQTLDDGTTLGKYSEALEKVGINIKDQNGQLKDMDVILNEMGSKWQTLNKDQQVALAQNVAGVRQYTQLVALMDNWDKFTANLNTANNATGALQKQQDIYMESTEAHLQKLSTEAERTYDILFDTKTVNGFADALSGVLGVFNNLIAGVGGGASAFTYLGSIATSIFSNQIGGAITRQIENLEAMKKNTEALGLKQQIADMYTMQGEVGVDPNSVRIEKEAEVYQQIAGMREQITQEEYNQLTAMQKQMGIDAERLSKAENYRELLTGIFNDENVSLNTMKKRASEIGKQTKEYENQQTTLEEIRDLMLDIENATDDDRSELLDELIELEGSGTQNLQFTKQELEEIYSILANENSDTTAVWDILDNKADLLNGKLEQQYQTEERINEAIQQKQFLESEEYKTLQQEQTARQGIIDQMEQQAQRQKAISATVQALGVITTTLTTISGIIKTINDDSLTTDEKVERILTTVVTTLPIIIPQIISIAGQLPTIAIGLGLISATNYEVAKSAGTAGAALWSAFWPVLAIMAAVAVAIAGVVLAVKALSAAYNKDANAAAAAAKNAQELTETYENAKQKAQDLKDTISDYSDALTQLQELKSGTEEYTTALDKANAKAKELMETYNLYDKAQYKNGVLTFDEGTLESLQSRVDEQTQMAAVRMYNAKIYANNASLKSQTTDTARSTGRAFDPRGLINDSAAIMTPFVLLDDTISVTNNQVMSIIENLKKLKAENEIQYEKIRNSNQAFQEWIKSTYDGNYNMELLSEQIGKNRNAFIDLLDATERVADANSQYYNEINKIAIEGKYGKEITSLAMSSDGTFNQGLYDQVVDIFNNSSIQERVKQEEQAAAQRMQSKTVNLAGDTLTSQEAWSHEFEQGVGKVILPWMWGNDKASGNLNTLVTQKLKGNGISDEYLNKIIGRSNLDSNRDLAEAYAKLTGTDVTNATWKGDKFLNDAGDTVLDASNADARAKMRSQIYTDVATKYNNEQIQNAAEEESKGFLNTLQDAKANAAQAGQEYGTDFTMALFNAISSKTNEFDLSDVYSALSPEEVEDLQGKSTEDILNMFGLDEEKVKTLGFESGQQFAENFQSGLEGYKWDPTAAVENVLSGKDKELEGFGLKKEDVADYSEYLMDIANSAEDAQDGLNDLANEMEHNAEAAVTVAKSVMRMNNGVEKLADGQKDWIDILKKSGMESQEYYDALRGIQDAFGDLLDLSEDTEKYLDGDFFTKNADLIAQAAEGSADAIDKLRDAAADSIIFNIAVENGLDETAVADIQGKVNELQSLAENIVVGTELDLNGLDIGETDFLNKCQEIINGAHMTAEQANAFFESMGFQTNFATEEKDVEQSSPITVTETRVRGYTSGTATKPDGTEQAWEQPILETSTYQDGTATFTGKQTVMAMATSPDGSKVPIINSMTKKATGSSNNYSKKQRGGASSPKKSSGGGGSKAKEPNKMDKLDDQADRYHKVNTQIAKVENSLKKLTSQEDKLVGSKLIANLNAQWAQLNTQVANYNKKLRIAQGEQAELRKELAGKGAKFNADGTISNYMEAFAARQNYVNSLIDKYNSMSAEEQEKYKETIEKAKEDFKEFQEDLDKYDKLISDEIPGLRQSIQDAIDQQIEINIKKFNMEVDITLNMAEAERDWNKWKAKVLDGVKETDILGNAQARLQDFSSYYNQQATASIQVQTRHLENTLSELKKIDAGLDNVYGDNRSQALEDLQTYYQQLMEDLEGVLDLQTEIHQAYLDMMDEAQEKFDEQLDTYEMIGDLLQNNMKIVQLVYGEDSYSQLSNYYQQEYDNNVNRLDFLRQQKQLWADQMKLFEEGSEEWKSAKEKWMKAAQELSSTLVDSLETARESFENTIKEIFQDLNNLVTNDLGLDYVKEEWDLINKNADEYLDTINAVAGIRDLESKYIDAINDADSTKNQQRLNALMESELNTLRSMDKISQADLDRAKLKYQIALAQLALEDAQQKKTQMRLRRDSQGNYSYQYTADEDAINKAKEELSNLYVDLYNFDKDKYKENLDTIYSVWEEYQQKMAEAALINDPEVRAQRELLIQQEYDELLNGLLEKNTAFRTYLQESSFMTLSQLYQTDLMNFTALTQGERDSLLNEVGGAFNTLLEVYGIDTEAFKNMTLEEQNVIITNLGSAFQTLTGFYNEDKKQFDKLETDNTAVLTEKMVPQWTSAIQTMADKISGKGGLQQTTEASMTKIKNATAQYDKQVETLAKTAGKTTTEIGKGLDKDITKTQQLVTDNTKLITSYNNELKAVKKVCDQIDTLIKKYQNAESAAKKATEAAYKYWLQEQQKQAAAAKKQTQTSSSSGSNSSSSSSGGGGSSAPASPQGNGNVDVGDKVTLNGKLAVSSYNSPTLTPISRYRGAQLYVQMINNGAKSPYHLGTSPSYSSLTAVGWVDRNQISGYDTGGYTGEWDNKDGRLAVLHEKELVLNAKDTENMLNTVTIMRNLATTLGGNVLAKLAGVAAGNGNGKVDTTDTIEQNVHIDATFPGVKDAKEIEDALNNLVNSATQRIFEKR